MADAVQGYEAQLALDAASPIDTNSEPYEFLSCSFSEQIQVLDSNGIRGTRSHHTARTREGNKVVQGNITMHPSPADLDNLLPRILGAAEATDTFALADTLPEFVAGVNLAADAFEYRGCKVNRATFSSGPNQMLTLSLDILGKTKNDLTYPSLTLGVAANNAPYVFSDSDSAVTIVGSARDILGFELSIDNQLDARFTNSQTATSITPRDRIISCRFQMPYNSDNIDVYNNGTTGAAASLVFTNGGMSTTFTLADLRIEPVTPTVNGKGEIVLQSGGMVRMTGSTKEIVITHDSVA